MNKVHFAAAVLFLASLTAATTGCGPADPLTAESEFPVDGRTVKVSVREGEQAAVEGFPVTLRFVRVVQDSRCPKNATCVWIGEGTVAVELVSGSRKESAELKISGAAGREDEAAAQPVVLLGYRLALLELQPYPETPPAPASRATAVIRIER